MSYIRFGQVPQGVPAVKFNLPTNPSGTYIQTFNTNQPLFPYVGQKKPAPLYEAIWRRIF